MAKSNKKLLLIAGGLLFVAAIGGTIYYFKKKKGSEQNSEGENLLEEENTTEKEGSVKSFPAFVPPAKSGNTYLPPAPSNPKRKDVFPIGNGSSGEKVKLIQLALIKTYGKGILPKYGADGYWGKELESALQSKNIPFPISEASFNSFFKTGGTTASQISDAGTIAKNLRTAIFSRNKEKTLVELRKIKSVADYSSVNEIFKKIPFGIVRYTLVNAALSYFSGKDKEAFRTEFFRMGLKFDSTKNQWTLSGILPMVITNRDTVFTTADGKSFSVPAGFRIGQLVSQEDRTAEILTADGKRLFASSATLKTLLR